MENEDNYFNRVNPKKLGAIRPGIMRKIDEYRYKDRLTASMVGSRADARRIGANLSIINKSQNLPGFEVVRAEVDQQRPNRYWIEGSLDSIIEKAEEIFQDSIEDCLNSYSTEKIIEDKERYGFKPVKIDDEFYLPEYRGPGYHKETIDFLNDLVVVDDDRRLITDDRDIEFIKETLEKKKQEVVEN